MKCSRCGRELAEDQRYVYQDRVMCENCLMDIGLSLKECDPWATYVDTAARKRRGVRGPAELTELEAQVYSFVKDRGRATREEVMENLRLSERDLDAQLIALMHSELVKERSEGGKRFLVTIG